MTFQEGLDVTATGQALDDILAQPITGGQVYMCGPGPFMGRAETAAQARWPLDAINLERFAAKPALAGTTARRFSVELARSGVTLDVAADETILEVLEANQIDAVFSCEQGVCGTCVCDIVSGRPDHRDSFLSAHQRKSGRMMCLCVSRGAGEKIVLDL